MIAVELIIADTSFVTECTGEETVLDVLETLSAGTKNFPHYRHSCHHGSCGTCGAVINGAEALMCLTRIADLAKSRPHPLGKGSIEPLYRDGKLVISLMPLKKATVISGIAVHPAMLFSGIPSYTSYKAVSARQDILELEADPSCEELYRELCDDAARRGLPQPDKEAFTKAQQVRNKLELCIECGLCLSACPETFRGPAGLSAIHAELKKLPATTQDGRNKLLDLARAPDGTEGCKRHIACSRVCPQGVAPARRIQELRSIGQGTVRAT